jgi:hypothetical protein
MPQIWNIYHISNCRQARPSPKPKFVAIVCYDNTFMGFLINFNIHPFIQRRPYLLVGQALIDVANHPFLDADSYIDCNELCEFEDFELNNRNYRGAIGIRAKEAIKKAVSSVRTIAPHYKNLILG